MGMRPMGRSGEEREVNDRVRTVWVRERRKGVTGWARKEGRELDMA